MYPEQIRGTLVLKQAESLLWASKYMQELLDSYLDNSEHDIVQIMGCFYSVAILRPFNTNRLALKAINEQTGKAIAGYKVLQGNHPTRIFINRTDEQAHNDANKYFIQYQQVLEENRALKAGGQGGPGAVVVEVSVPVNNPALQNRIEQLKFGDLNEDGEVNLTDFMILADNFGKSY